MMRAPVEPAQRKPLTKRQKAEIIDRQKGLCTRCGKPLGKDVDYHHSIPLELGGLDTLANREALHPDPCHRELTKQFAAIIAKGKRIRAKADGTWRPKREKLPKGRTLQGRGFDKTMTRTLRGKVKERTGPARIG